MSATINKENFLILSEKHKYYNEYAGIGTPDISTSPGTPSPDSLEVSTMSSLWTYKTKLDRIENTIDYIKREYLSEVSSLQDRYNLATLDKMEANIKELRKKYNLIFSKYEEHQINKIIQITKKSQVSLINIQNLVDKITRRSQETEIEQNFKCTTELSKLELEIELETLKLRLDRDLKFNRYLTVCNDKLREKYKELSKIYDTLEMYHESKCNYLRKESNEIYRTRNSLLNRDLLDNQNIIDLLVFENELQAEILGYFKNLKLIFSQS
ncbi:hypothetical protein cand_037300 [Cryptosporidium andersoni]|uniref:Uncharacterized protein n=1 Tax=Cryptosporidium andersoni TaxID=117008 RepID=A0A1J4MUI4_9CRYT|nr:hypothetical protein cand_037300 [Cryptosporidium andersoni]